MKGVAGRRNGILILRETHNRGASRWHEMCQNSHALLDFSGELQTPLMTGLMVTDPLTVLPDLLAGPPTWWVKRVRIGFVLRHCGFAFSLWRT